MRTALLGRRSDESALVAEHDELDAVAGVEFGEDTRYMGFDDLF